MANMVPEERILDDDHEFDGADQDLDDLNLVPLSSLETSRKRWLTIEPIVFLLFFAVNLSSKSNHPRITPQQT